MLLKLGLGAVEESELRDRNCWKLSLGLATPLIVHWITL